MSLRPEILLLVVLSACGGRDRPAADAETAKDTPAAAPSGPDPCGLVAAAEVEALIGPLAEPPYRVNSDREPKPDGEGCLYRARDRRNVTVIADFEDGPLSFQMMAGTGKAVSDILVGYEAETDTLEGGWDKIGSAFGQLIVLKDSVSVQVDPLGSRIGLAGAVKIAGHAVRRVGAPLAYDGAAATRAHREPDGPSGDPCRLVTRAEAEALMGPLDADPRAASDGSGCEFKTKQEFFGHQVTRKLEVAWRDGFYLLGQEVNGMGGAAKVMANQMDPDLPALGRDTVDRAEPWDQKLTLMGVVAVVKGDVLLKIGGDGIGGFDEKKALALLRSAVAKI